MMAVLVWLWHLTRFTRCNIEVYQGKINQEYNTELDILIVYYSTLLSATYAKDYKQPGLDEQMIIAKQLDDIANKYAIYSSTKKRPLCGHFLFQLWTN